MKVLVLGSGGREHALSWVIGKSAKCEKLFIAPGNAGTEELGENVDLDITDFPSIRKFVLDKGIGLVVVGPEEPLVKGIVDFFEEDQELRSVPILGPSMEGARLEGSKAYAKSFMERNGIPTAKYSEFNDSQFQEAIRDLDNFEAPYVIKADGLAAGKGVIICNEKNEAEEVIKEFLLNEKLGNAGKKLIIEEFLDGIEFSVFALTDGNDYLLLPVAKDYKRAGENDSGPNTGGMGAVSPVPFVTEEMIRQVKTEIVEPSFEGLKKEGIPFRGFLYFGLMKTSRGIYVLEYNVRMGDPETEVVLPRIESDLLPLFLKAATGKLKGESLSVTGKSGITVVMVSGGYPGSYEKGKKISGIEKVKDQLVFQAGTKKVDGETLTNGGRVLCVTALADSLSLAIDQAYSGIGSISFEKSTYRKDIGKDVLR